MPVWRRESDASSGRRWLYGMQSSSRCSAFAPPRKVAPSSECNSGQASGGSCGGERTTEPLTAGVEPWRVEWFWTLGLSSDPGLH